jgi:hypothetical protein
VLLLFTALLLFHELLQHQVPSLDLSGLLREPFILKVRMINASHAWSAVNVLIVSFVGSRSSTLGRLISLLSIAGDVIILGAVIIVFS